VQGLECELQGLGLRVSGFGFRVSGFGFWISDFGFRVSGLFFGFLVSGKATKGYASSCLLLLHYSQA